MTDHDDRRKAAKKIADLIREVPIAMLTTCLPDHSLNSRPMVNVNSGFEGDLWFFTHADDPKVREIQGNPQVNVSFVDAARKHYVSIWDGCAGQWR